MIFLEVQLLESDSFKRENYHSWSKWQNRNFAHLRDWWIYEASISLEENIRWWTFHIAPDRFKQVLIYGNSILPYATHTLSNCIGLHNAYYEKQQVVPVYLCCYDSQIICILFGSTSMSHSKSSCLLSRWSSSYQMGEYLDRFWNYMMKMTPFDSNWRWCQKEVISDRRKHFQFQNLSRYSPIW